MANSFCIFSEAWFQHRQIERIAQSEDLHWSKACSYRARLENQSHGRDQAAPFRACLTSLRRQRFQLKDLYAATNREKGIFSRCTDHDDSDHSSKGRRKSCLVLSGDGFVQEIENFGLPSAIFLVGVILSTVALKVRKAYLVVPAIARSTLVFFIPGHL